MKSKIQFSANLQTCKPLFKFTLLMFSFFFYFSPSVSAQDGCPVECSQNWSTPNKVLTIPAPGFPNCEILVVYRDRRCAGGQLGLFVDILHWQVNGGDCTALLSSIFPNFPNGPYNANQTVLDAILEGIQEGISLHIFMNVYNSLPSSVQTEYHCPKYNAVGTITFQNFTCQSTCYTRRIGDLTGFYFTPTTCSTEGCCSRVIQHCFNPTTGLVETQETVATEGNPPCQGPLPTCNIPSGYEFVGQTDCGGECD